jgi:putative nucleotidyltransferase with HDIG domain
MFASFADPVDLRYDVLHDLLRSQPEELHQHSHAVARLAGDLARAIGCSPYEQERIQTGALLHDIGKQFIPSAILDKEDSLTPAEYRFVQQHVELGHSYLLRFVSDGILLNTVLYHHERWDGGGYPFGMAGEDIPLGGRICALADVWDALVTDRCYHKAWSMTRAARFIWSQAGTAFDPQLAEQFLNVLAKRYIDGSLHRIRTRMTAIPHRPESAWLGVPIVRMSGGTA